MDMDWYCHVNNNSNNRRHHIVKMIFTYSTGCHNDGDGCAVQLY